MKTQNDVSPCARNLAEENLFDMNVIMGEDDRMKVSIRKTRASFSWDLLVVICMLLLHGGVFAVEDVYETHVKPTLRTIDLTEDALTVEIRVAPLDQTVVLVKNKNDKILRGCRPGGEPFLQEVDIDIDHVNDDGRLREDGAAHVVLGCSRSPADEGEKVWQVGVPLLRAKLGEPLLSPLFTPRRKGEFECAGIRFPYVAQSDTSCEADDDLFDGDAACRERSEHPVAFDILSVSLPEGAPVASISLLDEHGKEIECSPWRYCEDKMMMRLHSSFSGPLRARVILLEECTPVIVPLDVRFSTGGRLHMKQSAGHETSAKIETWCDPVLERLLTIFEEKPSQPASCSATVRLKRRDGRALAKGCTSVVCVLDARGNVHDGTYDSMFSEENSDGSLSANINMDNLPSGGVFEMNAPLTFTSAGGKKTLPVISFPAKGKGTLNAGGIRVDYECSLGEKGMETDVTLGYAHGSPIACICPVDKNGEPLKKDAEIGNMLWWWGPEREGLRGRIPLPEDGLIRLRTTIWDDVEKNRDPLFLKFKAEGRVEVAAGGQLRGGCGIKKRVRAALDR